MRSDKKERTVHVVLMVIGLFAFMAGCYSAGDDETASDENEKKKKGDSGGDETVEIVMPERSTWKARTDNEGRAELFVELVCKAQTLFKL